MKESIGYTITLNIAIVFIVIIFATLAMSLSYYKAYKVSNVITQSIEKYEGYNELAETEILSKLSLLGYNFSSITCKPSKGSCNIVATGVNSTKYSQGEKGYCVYKCDDSDNKYHYKTLTNMLWNFPIVNNMVSIPVEINTKNLYDFNGSESDISKYICKPVTNDTKTTGNVPQGNFNYGDEYICNTGGEYRTFLVLENGRMTHLQNDYNAYDGISGRLAGRDEISLIMNQNIDTTGVYIPDGTFKNINDQLESLTSTWTNIPRNKITLPTMEQIYSINGTALYENLWLFDYVYSCNEYTDNHHQCRNEYYNDPFYSAVGFKYYRNNQLIGSNVTVPITVYQNYSTDGYMNDRKLLNFLGYWTSTCYASDCSTVWTVAFWGRLHETNRLDNQHMWDDGIRPVITIPRSLIQRP